MENRNIFSSFFGAIRKNKWIAAFVITAIALVAAIVVAIIIGVSSGNSPDYFEGDEVGVYYYDVADGEIIITLSGSNKFTIAGPQINKTGTYSIDGDGKIVFDYIRDEDGTGEAVLTGTTLVFDSMSFQKKVNYKVTFNTNGGSAIDPITVVNGKTLVKPADPTRSGYAFIGWYSDEALTKPFDCSSVTVTADITLYARWAEDPVGVGKYTIKLDLGYEGASAYDDIITNAGIAYDVPTPTREGYTFGGWWISMYENADKLSYIYTADTVFSADTTLYAIWLESATGKLASPMVSVKGNTISWDSVSGAISYTLTIADEKGNVIVNGESVATTTKVFDFAAQPAGNYIVSVAAVSSNAANNSDPCYRYVANKALNRVSKFAVIDGIVVYNAVEGATKYLVTVDCGNDAHEHTLFDNGASTSFSIVNCPMQKGGIKITVTAMANGRASSTSVTYVYDRTLNVIPAIVYNSETDSFVWDAVAGASSYTVTVKVGDETYTFVNGNKTSFSIAGFTGEISVSVVPTNAGFNSPDPAVATYTKKSPATPTGIKIKGTVISWDASEGATSYEIMIGESVRTTNTNSFDAKDENLQIGSNYTIRVKAVNGVESSAYSEAVTVGYRKMNTDLTYYKNTVSWSPVFGVTTYKIRVNGDNNTAFTVENATSAKVALTKAGVNTIEVKFNDYGGSDWVSIDVTAYEVKYMPRNAQSEFVEYLAVGDALTLPLSYTYSGYDFTEWYSSPSGAAGNGKVYTSGATFHEQGNLVLYADWTPVEYNVSVQTDGYDITNLVNGENYPAIYTKKFTLPVPVSSNGTLTNFAGWFTGPAGSGNQLTDANGNSLGTYQFTRDIIAYPFYDTGILTFTLKSDNTYAVGKGPNIDTVTNLTIPSSYNGLPVSSIVENAFSKRTKLVSVNIPDSIKTVGAGAFADCTALEYIDVYKVEGRHEVFYGSDDGALVHYDYGTTYLELYPRAKTGTYNMSDDIEVILNKAFQYSKLSKIVVGKGVTTVSKYAFYYCRDLVTLEFAEGRAASVSFDPLAFYQCTVLSTIKLPATLNTDSEELATVLGRLTKLSTIDVEEGGQYYSTVDGMLTNAAKNTIVFCPVIKEGELVIPQGIQEIGPKAFANRKGITSIVVPAYVKVIGKQAFYGCSAVKSITVNGARRNNLVIGDYAFANMTSLESVTFKGNEEGTLETGVITIGNYAFAPHIDDDTINTSLKTVTFESGVNVASIGDYAFANQIQNISLAFGENTSILAFGNHAFENNTSLYTINIPKTTTSIGSYAFSGCTGVRTVELVEGAAEITFGEYSFSNCERLSSITLPSTVRNFDGSAFDGCDAIDKIEVADGNPYLKSDENGVLYQLEDGVERTLLFYPKRIISNNGGVVSNILETVTTIGSTVFANYSELKEITIGKNVTYIGERAFANCVNLKKVNFESEIKELNIGNYAFDSCTALLYGSNFTLPATTVTIGDYAFQACKFTSFTIPESVTAIGEGAFYSNASLTSITIPAKVAYIGDKAFASCTNMTKFTVTATPEGETPVNLVLGDLGNGAKEDGVFYKSNKLATVNFGDRVNSIGGYAFYGITKITAITLSDNLVDIGNYAFYDTRIAAITIPNTVQYIGEGAFGVAKETNAKIAKDKLIFEMGGTDPLEICKDAFLNQKLVQSVTLPYRVSVLNEAYTETGTLVYNDIADRFSGMTALASINIEKAPEGTVAKYVSIDGVVYETDENGTVVTLLYCPIMNTGKNGTLEVIVPKTVRTVARGAFYLVKSLKTVTFEDYAETDPEYGQPLLVIGCEGVYSSYTSTTHRVFGGGANETTYNSITKITFPSHLGFIGNAAISNTKDIATIEFSPASTEVELANYAFYQCNAASLKLYNVSKIGTHVFDNCKSATSIEFTIAGDFDTIPNSMFYACTSLVSYTIPKGVKFIEDSAFSKCTNLKTITFEQGSKCESIGDWAFSNCLSLTSINISECKLLNNIGEFDDYGLAFQNCMSLETIDLSGCVNLSYIANQTFQGCDHLKSFTFPDGVQSVGYDLFKNCTALEEVTLSSTFSPAMLTSSNGSTIKSNFFGCQSLKKINIPEGNIYFSTDSYGALYDKMKTIIYFFPPAADPTGYVMPTTVTEIVPYAFAFYPGEALALHEGIETIGSYAFYFNKFESIHVPSTVKTIGNYAFTVDGSLESPIVKSYATDGTPSTYYSYASLYTSNLKTVTFAPGCAVESLGSGLFYYADKLETVVLPDSIKTMGSYVFRGCKSLTEIILPAALQSLSTYSFDECSALKKIVLQEGITIIDSYAFHKAGTNRNNSLSVHIPSTVKSIGNYAFAYVYSLTDLTFDPDGELNSIGTYVFRDISAKSIVFPPMLASIEANAFLGSNTIEYVEFTGTALKEIPNAFFKGFTVLKNVVLPEGLERIGDSAFSNPSIQIDSGLSLEGAANTYSPCIALESIKIPSSVNYIGKGAFAGCTSLESVEFEAGSNVTAFGDDAITESAIFANTPALKSIILPQNLTLIGARAFENSGLADIELPSTVTTIGNSAFKNCDNLTKIDLFGNITYIGDHAFYDCDALEVATPSFGLESIGALAFAYCEKLTEAYIPATVNNMSGNPYVGCSGVNEFSVSPDNEFYLVVDEVLYDTNMSTILYYPASIDKKEVTISEKVNEIAPGAFAGASMEKITLPARLVNINANAFQNCPNLTTVVIESGIKSIGDYAFAGCPKLNNVVVPSSVQSIGDYAFSDCTGISEFTFEETSEVNAYLLGTNIFDGCTSMTEVTLPNFWMVHKEDYLEDGNSETNYDDKNAGAKILPRYMFANTGIVHAVIPANVQYLTATGTFMNCKQLESVEFLTHKIISTVIGDYMFYGCSSLRAIEMPPTASTSSPFDGQKGYSFAYCTSLESFTCYYTQSSLAQIKLVAPKGYFLGCEKLRELNFYKIAAVVNTDTEFEYNIVGTMNPPMRAENFKGCTSLTSYDYFPAVSSSVTVHDEAFADSGITAIEFKPLIVNQGAFKNCTSIKNAYLHPFVSSATSFSKFYANAFAGWTEEQNIYIVTMTREEFMELVAMNTAENAATYDEIFADCEANVYFKEDIVNLDTVNVGALTDQIKLDIISQLKEGQKLVFEYHSYTELCKLLTTKFYTTKTHDTEMGYDVVLGEIVKHVNGASKIAKIFISSSTTAQKGDKLLHFLTEAAAFYGKSENVTTVTAEEFAEYMIAGIFANSKIEVYDKDGNALTYNSANKTVTVKNPGGETIATYVLVASTADELAGIDFTGAGNIYLNSLGFDAIFALQAGAAEYDAFKGLTVIYDKDGFKMVVDPTTGLVKDLYFTAEPYVVSSSMISTKYGINYNKYDFTKLGEDVTVHVSGSNYESIIEYESDLTDNFKGCKATFIHEDGTTFTFDDDGKLELVTDKDGNQLYPQA